MTGTDSTALSPQGERQPIVDSHLHIWDRRLFSYPWLEARPDLPAYCDLPAQRPDLEFVAIESGVDSRQAEQENAWLEARLASRSDCIGIVAAIDVTSDPAQFERALERMLRSTVLAGFRLHASGKVPDSSVQWQLIASGARESSIACEFLVRRTGLRSLLDQLGQIQFARFAIDHGGDPPVGSGWDSPEFSAWRGHMSEISQDPRAYVKLSAALRRTPSPTVDELRVVEFLLESFGMHRCMLGSDWPVSQTSAERSPHSLLDRVLELAPGQFSRQVLRDTAHHFYERRCR